MQHARAALTEAYKTLQDQHPNVFGNLGIRKVFRVVLLVISSEEQVAKTWNDVKGVILEATEAHLPEEMTPIKPAVEKALLDVLAQAKRIAPVYISPPPFN